MLSVLHLLRPQTSPFPVLQGVSGVLKPVGVSGTWGGGVWHCLSAVLACLSVLLPCGLRLPLVNFAHSCNAPDCARRAG